MSNGERCIPEARFFEDLLVLWFAKLVVKLLEERRVTSRGQARFFIEKSKDAKFPFNDIDTRLIVREVNESPVDFFLDVFFLFKFEDMRVELMTTIN